MYRLIASDIQSYEYFHFTAADFTNSIHLGFSDGFNGHNDTKWEIVIGGFDGRQHLIRDQNLIPPFGLINKTNENR